LLVGNSGPAVATDVMVTFDPPLRDTPGLTGSSGSARQAEERLNAGLASLPPGRTLRWWLGLPHEVFEQNQSGPLSYTVTINADGPFGRLESLSYTMDLNDWRNNWATPLGTLHGVALAVKELGKAITKNSRAALSGSEHVS
jgi:hypothetical protein